MDLSKLDENDITPITFKAKIVYYPATHQESTTISQFLYTLNSKEYEVEGIVPFDTEPTLIVKPNSYAKAIAKVPKKQGKKGRV